MFLGQDELPESENGREGNEGAEEEDAHDGNLLGERDLQTRNHEDGQRKEDNVDGDVTDGLADVVGDFVNTMRALCDPPETINWDTGQK